MTAQAPVTVQTQGSGRGALSDRTPGSRGLSRAGGWPRFILQRLVDIVLTVWAAATLAFLAVKAIPGDPLDILMSGIQDATPEMRARIAADYGLDQPAWRQYLDYLGGVLTGDLGTSYQRGTPVLDVLSAELAPTVELTLVAMLIAVTLAVAVALATSGRNRTARFAAQFVELVAVSTPAFWLGIILMTVFSFQLRLLPAFGNETPESLILPAVTLASTVFGVLSQILRERMEFTLHEPFVKSLRARGLGEGALRSRHVLRHAGLPALTLSSMIFGSLLGGTVIIETLFARPGIGRVAVMAVQDRDIPVVLGFVILASLIFVLVNTVVDLVYPLIDPRLKGERR